MVWKEIRGDSIFSIPYRLQRIWLITWSIRGVHHGGPICLQTLECGCVRLWLAISTPHWLAQAENTLTAGKEKVLGAGADSHCSHLFTSGPPHVVQTLLQQLQISVPNSRRSGCCSIGTPFCLYYAVSPCEAGPLCKVLPHWAKTVVDHTTIYLYLEWRSPRQHQLQLLGLWKCCTLRGAVYAHTRST